MIYISIYAVCLFIMIGVLINERERNLLYAGFMLLIAPISVLMLIGQVLSNFSNDR